MAMPQIKVQSSEVNPERATLKVRLHPSGIKSMPGPLD